MSLLGRLFGGGGKASSEEKKQRQAEPAMSSSRVSRRADICVVDINPEYAATGTPKHPPVPRGFFNRNTKELLLLRRDEQGVVQWHPNTIPDFIHLFEGGDADAGHVLTLVPEPTVTEALFSLFWGFWTLWDIERANPNDAASCAREAHQLLEELQVLIDRDLTKEPRHAELNDLLSKQGGTARCQEGDVSRTKWTQWPVSVPKAYPHSGQEIWQAVQCEEYVVFLENRTDRGLTEVVILGLGPSERKWQVVSAQLDWRILPPERQQQVCGKSIKEIMRIRGHLGDDRNVLSEVDRLIWKVVFKLLLGAKKLVDSLACPPLEYLLAPAASFTNVGRDSKLLEERRQTHKAQVEDLNRRNEDLMHEAKDLKASLASVENERNKAVMDNNELRRNLSLLQQRENISGTGDFPLEADTVKYVKKATDAFEALYFRGHRRSVKGFNLSTCQVELSVEVTLMLQEIRKGVQSRYDAILEAMLASLEGTETPENASKMTRSFFELYCRNHWKQLFLGSRAQKQSEAQPEDNTWAADAFKSYCESTNLPNSLLLDMAWQSMSTKGKLQESFVPFESYLWKAFKGFWDASVVMYLHRPKFEFDFDSPPAMVDYNLKLHSIMDGACNKGEKAIVIFPAVIRVLADSEKEISAVARVVPKQDKGSTKGAAMPDWPKIPCYQRDAAKGASGSDSKGAVTTHPVPTNGEDADNAEHKNLPGSAGDTSAEAKRDDEVLAQNLEGKSSQDQDSKHDGAETGGPPEANPTAPGGTTEGTPNVPHTVPDSNAGNETKKPALKRKDSSKKKIKP
ncbi:unnamed protein product [Ostreobium quekettii]|uniref:Uncharacterized protein n=1 Tax=Ostreobium quekettii TaxID=121088 RepID=A0A8S1IWT9_9CHLO|nr:unnamed protein product [Ostreobium quekettii]